MSDNTAVALAEFREQSLNPIMDRLTAALAGEMPVERMMQTIMVSLEKTPKLLQANRQSVVAAAMTACLLRLPVDGATGQGYLIPFKGMCQFIPGYKGLVTLAGRSSFAVHNDIVRENDDFDLTSGSNPSIHHKPDPRLTAEERGKAIGAYAVFRSNILPTVIQWMPISEIIKIRDKSAGYKNNPSKSLWTTDPTSMALKTPIRVGFKKVPHEIGGAVPDMHRAAALEEQFDLGRIANLDEQGVVHSTFVNRSTEHGAQSEKELGERIKDAEPQSYELKTAVGATMLCDGLSHWANNFLSLWENCDGNDRQRLMVNNEVILSQLKGWDAYIAERVAKATDID